MCKVQSNEAKFNRSLTLLLRDKSSYILLMAVFFFFFSEQGN